MQDLRNVIGRSFQHRGIPQSQFTHVFSAAFWDNPILQDRWRIFLRRSRLEAPETLDQVLQHLKAFLAPVMQELDLRTWQPDTKNWE